MEVLLADILATILTSVPLLAEKTRQRKEEENQRRIEENRRHEEAQRQKLEDNRWHRFMEIAHQWRDAEIASSFIATLKQLPVDGAQQAGAKTMDEWMQWAEMQLLSRNPLNKGAKEIWDSVSKTTAYTYRNQDS